MEPLSRLVRRFCVRSAERAGWLNQIRSEVVDSYLSRTAPVVDSYLSRTAPSDMCSESRRFNFPTVSFVALAVIANAALVFTVSLPEPGFRDLLQSRERDAIGFYESIVGIQNAFQSRDDMITPDSQKSLYEARAGILGALKQLNELRAEQAAKAGAGHDPNVLRLESIRRTLELASREESGRNPLQARAGHSPSLAPAYEEVVNSFNEIRANLASAKLSFERQPAAEYAYATEIGRQVITREKLLSRSTQFPSLDVVSESRLPNAYRDWTGFVSPEGKPYDAAEVLGGKSMRSVAGGITMASTSVAEAPRDLSSFILSYDVKKQRLALLGPKSESYYSDPIDPQTLKALNAFVTKGQTIAASIGWGGKFNERNEPFSTVLLDPTFVDTASGQNLVRADSIPWEFKRSEISGWHNPFAGQFRAAYDKFSQSQSSELNEFLSRRRLDEDSLNRLAAEVETRPKLRAFMEGGCSIDPARLQLLILFFREKYPGMNEAEAAQALDMKFFHRTTLATLYNKAPSFRLEPGKLVLKSGLEYRYVTSKIDYGEEIRFGKCLKGEDVTRIGPLEQVVNSHVSDIEQAFPSVQKVNQYGATAAFLRWARQPGHLQAVDFFELLGVPAHDVASTPTPDQLR